MIRNFLFHPRNLIGIGVIYYRVVFFISSLSIDKFRISRKESEADTAIKGEVQQLQLPWFLKHIQLHSINIKQGSIDYGANSLRVNGSLDRQWRFNWRLTIPQLNKLVSKGKGQLIVEGKIAGARSAPEFYLLLPKTDFIWQDWKFKQIHGELRIKDKKWFCNLLATQFQKAAFAIYPIQMHFSGSLRPFSLRGTLSHFKLSRLTETDGIKQANAIDMPTSEITAELGTAGLKAKFTTSQTSVMQQLSAAIQLPHYRLRMWRNRRQAIKGNIQLTLKNINYLANLLPYVKNSQGFLDARINLAGSVFSPTVDLTLNLKKGSTQIPALGLFLKKINLAFHTDKNLLQGTGQLNSGQGSLTFRSQTRLKQANFPSVIDVKANDLEISHTKEYKITASPVLRIQGNSRHLEVTGFILFPKAEVTLDEGRENLAELSPDIIFLDQKKKMISLPFTYKNNVRVRLGDNVMFSYQGLHTKITGALTIDQTTNHPTLATGELMLTDGTYKYYGQSLQLQARSFLLFAHSTINHPSVDISAGRSVWVFPEVDEKTNTPNAEFGSADFISSVLQTSQFQATRAIVGVRLQGYLENPQITLYADPPDAINSQLNKLSYLITGYPSSQLSAGSLKILLNAATNLGGKRSGFIQLIDNARKQLGIDQLDIGINPIFNPNTNSIQQNTSVIIGKNLSPRLSVSYSLGLLDPISILQINYLLTRHFSLQSTNSNFSNGIDLLYKVETR